MAINVHLDWSRGSTTVTHSACLYSSSLSAESRPTINKPRATPNFRNFSCVFNAIAIGKKRRKRRAFRLGGMCPVRKRTRRMEHEAPFPQQQQQQKSNQMLRNEMKRSGLSMRNEREESEISGSINFRLLSSLPSPPPSVKRFP